MASATSSTATSERTELRHGFKVAGLRLLPAANVLTEVVGLAEVFPVPKASGALIGVMNVRGNIVPLFDPGKVGQPVRDIRPTQQNALVFDRDERSVAVLLDATPELMTVLPAEGHSTLPASVLAPFLVRPWATANQPDTLWWEFNHRAAFDFLANPANAFPTSDSRSS